MRHFSVEGKNADKQNGDNSQKDEVCWRCKPKKTREGIGDLGEQRKQCEYGDKEEPENGIRDFKFRFLNFAKYEYEYERGTHKKENAKS